MWPHQSRQPLEDKGGMIILALVGQIDVHLEITSYAPPQVLTPEDGGGGRGENMSKRER